MLICRRFVTSCSSVVESRSDCTSSELSTLFDVPVRADTRPMESLLVGFTMFRQVCRSCVPVSPLTTAIAIRSHPSSYNTAPTSALLSLTVSVRCRSFVLRKFRAVSRCLWIVCCSCIILEPAVLSFALDSPAPAAFAHRRMRLGRLVWYPPAVPGCHPGAWASGCASLEGATLVLKCCVSQLPGDFLKIKLRAKSQRVSAPLLHHHEWACGSEWVDPDLQG